MASRGGFTLIELLVVILIILLVSAVALPVVLPALAHREVSEAARILQATLAGARDAALHDGTPSGIRLLPDPAFPLVFQANGQIDPTQPLAANRIIPIESAPEYSEGKLGIEFPQVPINVPYPIGVGVTYPIANPNAIGQVLMVKEIVIDNSGFLNAPTGWFWNIRVGDKLQINASGLWYTVVGPMVVTPQGGNSELFVNVGPPGTPQQYFQDLQGPQQLPVQPEFLFLVNGLDDNNNGWIDEGWDGVDNNWNQEVAGGFAHITDDVLEWETETWPGTVLAYGSASKLYTIQRRPAPVANAREVSLPTNVVIDLTMLVGSLPPSPAGVQTQPIWQFSERSQFPNGVINPFTGSVDILLNTNGSVVPTTLYSTPSSFGMSGFFHFWLAERSDVNAVTFANGVPQPLVPNQNVYLPIGNIKQQLTVPNSPWPFASLQGEYRIVSLFTRTGQVTTNDNVEFDNPLNPINAPNYNPLYPFLATEQGSTGGR
jgi:prepilin-type N-terminal cleavage/methylation domain-containing protein